MRTILNIVLHLVVVALLTLTTQVGAVPYLISIPVWRKIRKRKLSYWKRTGLNLVVFSTLYTIICFLVVPPIALHFGQRAGRVPLPLYSTKENPVGPARWIYFLANRNYVTPTLKTAVKDVAIQLAKENPGFTVQYLDGCFPFWDDFPLLPHLSHDDGKKLDITFSYIKTKNEKKAFGKAPSLIVYGSCEQPLPGEFDQASACEKKGYGYYSILDKLMPDSKKLKMDPDLTANIVKRFARHPKIGKIFLEPHLKKRMNLTSGKIRFHGCRAVRHDDHIHVQL